MNNLQIFRRCVNCGIGQTEAYERNMGMYCPSHPDGLHRFPQRGGAVLYGTTAEVLKMADYLAGGPAPETSKTPEAGTPPSGRARIGDWIPTFTGRQFWPFDPWPDEIDIRDIAHGLSNLCRFTGQTRAHYSVAQHSVYVCLAAPPEFALEALMHDAAEAYIGDLSTPVKKYKGAGGYGPMHEAVEERIMLAIAARFKFRYPFDPETEAAVKYADRALLATEKRDLFQPGMVPKEWEDTAPPLDWTTLRPWPQEMAEELFLQHFDGATIYPAAVLSDRSRLIADGNEVNEDRRRRR